MSDSIKDLLSGSLSSYGIGREALAAFVCVQFDRALVQVCGERAREYARAKEFVRNEIVVIVKSSAWAAQLQNQQAQLLEAVRKLLPSTYLITRLRFQISD